MSDAQEELAEVRRHREKLRRIQERRTGAPITNPNTDRDERVRQATT